MSYAYNFAWVGGKKFNTVALSDIDVVFVSVPWAFDKKYLEYHEALHYRGCLSTRALSWATGAVFVPEVSVTGRFRERYQSARFLFLAMQEFGDMKDAGCDDFLQNIKVSDRHHVEITPRMLAAYDAWLHADVFPPANVMSVTALAGDGHEKVLTKVCAGDKVPKKSPPAIGGNPKNFTNGWFMVSNPADGRIVSVEQQVEPENNEVTARALGKVLVSYPKVDCFLLDRNCKFAPRFKDLAKFKQIKTWAIDKFHGRKHNGKCPCNPYAHPKIMRRLKGVNTSVSEQVWSWFRNYSNTLNTMNSTRHKFLVLQYVRRHNAMMESGDTSHLNGHAAARKGMGRKRPPTPYPCTDKRKKCSVTKKKKKVTQKKNKKKATEKKKATVKRILKRPSGV